jgi:hypothetical protein
VATRNKKPKQEEMVHASIDQLLTVFAHVDIVPESVDRPVTLVLCQEYQ